MLLLSYNFKLVKKCFQKETNSVSRAKLYWKLWTNQFNEMARFLNVSRIKCQAHSWQSYIYIYISKCVREFIDTFARHTANLNVHRCSFLPNKHFSNRIFVSQYKIHHVYMFFTSNKSHAFFWSGIVCYFQTWIVLK